MTQTATAKSVVVAFTKMLVFEAVTKSTTKKFIKLLTDNALGKFNKTSNATATPISKNFRLGHKFIYKGSTDKYKVGEFTVDFKPKNATIKSYFTD